SSPADYFVKHATSPRPLPSDKNPRVSKRVSALILTMIDPDPSRRPSTPGAVVEAIRHILTAPREEEKAPSPGAAERKGGQPIHDALKAAGIQVKTPWDMSVAMRGKC